MSENRTNLRRSTRKVSPKSYKPPKLSDLLKAAGEISESSQSDEEFVDPEAAAGTARPELLFNEDEDMEGQQIFTFRTPKKRNALTNLAGSAKTPKQAREKLKLGQ